ncbi:Aste57867_13161 [Aphanomyces stellatus]|uniref:Aste57867_13161 protein n=1 Tax=Aphanomyces stellatus TaxID=120398 RepID=A0A485KXD8_9STRA|nr:hypothetical protein As57867_013112 [Aphanomyces stellatus]VFT90002.1 Aste57867_13161 [Aphanomyces stellatus]
MRREGIVYSKQRRQHIATNRTVHACHCMKRSEDYEFVVQTRATKQAIEDEKNAAKILLSGWRSKKTVLPSDLETLGLFSVESVADMDATHWAVLHHLSSHHDEVTRHAALRLATKFKQMEDERLAMQTLGLGARRHRDSLTKMERLRLEVLATAPPTSTWTQRMFRIIVVDAAAKIAPTLEHNLRACETRVVCARYGCKCCGPQPIVRKRWRYQNEDDDDEIVLSETESEDEGDRLAQSHAATNVSLFDFVDAAMTQTVAQSSPTTDDEYDMLQSDDDMTTPTSFEWTFLSMLN